MTKKSILLLLSSLLITGSGLSSCSAGNPANIPKGSYNPTLSIINVGKVQKGASITFKINLNNFKTKSTTTTTSGQSEVTFDEVDHFDVDLVKNATSPFPTTDDPLGNSVANFDNIDKDSTSITFTNVGDSSGDYYFVAVRAHDASHNDQIEIDNEGQGTPWGGSNRRVAVSTGAGVQVDSDNVLTTCCSDLPVTINLDDAIAATIGASLTVNPGDAISGAIGISTTP